MRYTRKRKRLVQRSAVGKRKRENLGKCLGQNSLDGVCVYQARYFVGGYEGRSLLRFAKSSDCESSLWMALATGEQRLIKSTTLKTFCLRFSRFFQYSRIFIPIPSLTLSLSVCLWFLVPSIRWTLIPDELTLMYDSGLNRLELIGNASRNLSCTVCVPVDIDVTDSCSSCSLSMSSAKQRLSAASKERYREIDRISTSFLQTS